MKRSALVVAGILAVLLDLQVSSGKQQGMRDSQSLAAVPPQAPRIDADYGKIPLHFIPNQGQVDGPAAFYVQGKDKTIYFAPDGLTFVLSGPRESTPERWVVKLDFMDANPEVIPASLEKSGAVVSYFKGGPKDWKAGIKASSKIIYRELWPGIDLLYYGTVDRMKYEFLVNPGADPSRIKLAYRGAESVELTEAGRLAIGTPLGGFEDDAPVAWQEVEKSRADVPVAYVLKSEGMPGSSTNVFGFEVGEYDKRLPLVVDPAVLIYCGYVGGMNLDEGKAIAVDDAGNVYITGYATVDEGTFPVTIGPDLTWNGDPEDAFVAKVKADGTGLAYCGFIGGGGVEEGYGIAVDAEGNAYVAGQTSSLDFPVTPGSELAVSRGQDAFVAKVKADGTELVYCGRIGGSGDDVGSGIAVDDVGHAYVTGWTFAGGSVNDFPVKVGPDLTYNGGTDVFVAKVKADGMGLDYCGYIGGWAHDQAFGIAVDAFGNAYVTGRTASPGDSFPVKVGPDLTHNEWFDAFVAKVSADGTGIVYCGYIGSYYDDVGRAIAVDDLGNAYVAGYTDYEQGTFPVKVGPDLTYNGGSADAFVAKVATDGSTLVYCGYIGSDAGATDYGLDHAYGIAVDSSGNAYVAGGTGGVGFPVIVGPDLTFNGWDDAFVAKVNAAGTALSYCGFIGGEFDESCIGIAVDGSGNAYVTGQTSSSEATFPVAVGPDLTLYESVYATVDAFVAKIASVDVPSPTLTSLIPPGTEAGGPALTLSLQGAGFTDGAVVRWDGDGLPTTYVNDRVLSAEIGAADMDWGRNVVVTVQNPDGGVSNALEFSLNNPVPSLTSLSPTQATGRGAEFILTLLGSNFVANSAVCWAGETKASLYVSGTELWALIEAADIRSPGLFPVTVVNPLPAGGTSNAISFPVAGFILGVPYALKTVTAGQSASYTVYVGPQYGSFDSAVSFDCSGLPNKCMASFSPASVTPGASTATTTLTLSTSAILGSTGSASGSISGMTGSGWPTLGLFAFIGVLLLSNAIHRCLPRISRRWLAACAFVWLIITVGGCSAGGGDVQPPPGTPRGAHQITVHGTSGSMTVSKIITLVVN